jgi:acyl dehydratase
MNYESLMGYPIPVVRGRYEQKEAILYALSVGAGEWLGQGAASFLTESAGPLVLPSLCLVLGHPGFWISDPATTADWRRNLHAEERFTIHAPLPAAAEIVGTTRIVDIVDKGTAKGALLYTEKTITNAQTGQLLAVVQRTQMLRGDGGYDGPSGPVRPAPSEPVGEPDIVRIVKTAKHQAFLYRLNGDPNPLHTDPEVAKSAGFEQPILHGLCTFGIAATAALFELAGGVPERIRSFGARFTSPVYPGETLQVELWHSGHVRVRVVERDIIALNHGHVTIGEAV